MRSFSWVMAGIGIGVGLTIMMMNEYKEAEARLAAGGGSGAREEEWPVGKSFDWGTKRQAEETVAVFAGSASD